MKIKLHTICLLITFTFSSLFMMPAMASDPMDDVFSLFESNGGTRSGKNEIDGYYVVSMGTSSRSSEAKGYEAARIDSLRQLSEMINGVSISGSTSSAMKHVSISDGSNSSEFSKSSFVDVVNMSFKGQLSAAKMLKKGEYDGDYFVATVITQSDINEIDSLKTNGSNGKGNTTIVIATDIGNKSIASFSEEAKSVEAKGLASMKLGESKAREQALQDALRNAVQQAQGVMLQGKSGQFNDALAMALSTKTEGYVSSYEILDEDMERGSYYVIIQAEVDGAKLLNDVNFYMDVFSEPVFSIESSNANKSDWLTNELERLGFSINSGKSTATHTFTLKQTQQQVQDHKNSLGIETSLSIMLKDNFTGQIIFSIVNKPMKTRIYVAPISRAKQVSEHVAFKQMKSKIGKEVIQALAKHVEQGVMYKIELKNAKRTDVDIFKHVLNNGTSGQVEGWNWDKKGKVMTLNYRFSGTLSKALDQSLTEIYATFKTQGKGRRPHMKKVDQRSAHFDIRAK